MILQDKRIILLWTTLLLVLFCFAKQIKQLSLYKLLVVIIFILNKIPFMLRYVGLDLQQVYTFSKEEMKRYWHS